MYRFNVSNSGAYQLFNNRTTHDIYKRYWDGTTWSDWIKVNGAHVVATSTRPTKPYIGLMCFDQNLSKPIWCKTAAVVDGGGAVTTPAVWVDATGTTV